MTNINFFFFLRKLIKHDEAATFDALVFCLFNKKAPFSFFPFWQFQISKLVHINYTLFLYD